jgi:uncharacterized damage-inducible protein DinB
MEPDAAHWQALLASNPDPDEQFVLRESGGESHATWGVRLAQAIHHGTDHRSQLCTGLTALGIEPPEIDVWEWAKTPGKYWYVDTPVMAGG